MGRGKLTFSGFSSNTLPRDWEVAWRIGARWPQGLLESQRSCCFVLEE